MESQFSMDQKELNSSLVINQLAKFGLTSNDQKVLQVKSKQGSKDTLFTNYAIVSSINKIEKNSNSNKISLKRSQSERKKEFGQCLRISSLTSKKGKSQKYLQEQCVSNANKIKKTDSAKYLGQRPKSAVCRSAGFNDWNTYDKQKISQTKLKQSTVQLQSFANEDKNNNKQFCSKDKASSRISFFTCNPNVFIPRTNCKDYGSYLNKTSMDQLKLKSKQQIPKQGQQKQKRSMISHLNEKELQKKCRQILKLDIKGHQASMSKSIINRKKVEYLHIQSYSKSQLPQSRDTICQETKTNSPSNNKFADKRFSYQDLEASCCEILKDVYKRPHIHKKSNLQLKIQKALKSKYRNQDQYFEVPHPKNKQANKKNLLSKPKDLSSAFQNKDHDDQNSTNAFKNKSDRDLSFHI